MRHGRGRREHVAVQGATFAVSKGGSLGIVGESGSGKTTLARIIVGLETATSGSIEVCGNDRTTASRSATERRQWARRVQMVFQDPYTSLDRRQTGTACIREVLAMHYRLDRAQRDSRIAELGDQVGLTPALLERTPSDLSGGQRQRLAIARALAVEPEVLVLDESVSALDVSVQAQVLNCLADIRQSLGMTFVFVSHDLGVIRQIADDVIVMKAGVIVERGSCADVLDRPEHEYTRLLKASVPRPGWRPSPPRSA
ncbi:ABC transporter ATP-binding protein [Microbacterium mangrovi]|uniref:ABC transporter ATP-binding protein n=2 Tax=Microbacterium mangrovi TaxID=1348253 RepID=A0A0B2ABN5_9MICO|nr:ABC transporter ATP-binding protein [Microbacterium mangrovi]